MVDTTNGPFSDLTIGKTSDSSRFRICESI
jgi:hypothetical protein